MRHPSPAGCCTKHLVTCFHVLAKGKVTGHKRARLLNDIGAATTNCLRYFQAAASSPGLFQPSAAAGVPPPRFHDIIDLLTMDHRPPLKTGLALYLAAERLKQIHCQHLQQHNATIIEQRIAERKAK